MTDAKLAKPDMAVALQPDRECIGASHHATVWGYNQQLLYVSDDYFPICTYNYT